MTISRRIALACAAADADDRAEQLPIGVGTQA